MTKGDGDTHQSDTVNFPGTISCVTVIEVLDAVFDPALSARDFITFSRDILLLRKVLPITSTICVMIQRHVTHVNDFERYIL